MDNEPRLVQVMREMRSEIRRLELENMGLKRVGNKLRRNATAPTFMAECKKSIIMTVRRYSIFQSLVLHHPADVTRVRRRSLNNSVSEAQRSDMGHHHVPK
ncbi:hypothetical protein DPEC_G00059560 [Dallia pectoralis]|uniref:Uncharacterized protein n=1 Tax=Dallia pectoralis TaxID=75939 RepID=A0ACC2H735_DALPE|nr:hypothetical protein DPEC_G00059560 [Dallia pectoralis]